MKKTKKQKLHGGLFGVAVEIVWPLAPDLWEGTITSQLQTGCLRKYCDIVTWSEGDILGGMKGKKESLAVSLRKNPAPPTAFVLCISACVACSANC